MSKISVYLTNSLVLEYQVADPMKGREHADAIVKTGYRSTPKDSDVMVYWPPHAILKVVVEGGGETTAYKDTARAT